jgi:hypothetical protein
MTDGPFSLHHMTNNHRMERLYNTLLGMGLIVFPIPNKKNPEEIEYFNVGVTLPHLLPKPRKSPSQASIDKKVERSKILDKIRSAKNDGSNVIDMPTIT